MCGCVRWEGGAGRSWDQALRAQRVFRLGEPAKRKDRAVGSFNAFDCKLIRQPFFISKYPVTVAQYDLFVATGGYSRDEFWTVAGRQWRDGQVELKNLADRYWPDYAAEIFPISRPQDYDAVYQTPNHPRVGVSWHEAQAYCAWLNSPALRASLGADLGWPADEELTFRLPSEAEWELAARWNPEFNQADDRLYPWGDAATEADWTARCNWKLSDINSTCAVGLFPQGRAGCEAEDMAGNVWEWCQTQWVDEDKIIAGKANLMQDYNSGVFEALAGDAARVLRGGSWNFSARDCRPASWLRTGPNVRVMVLGFRVCLMRGPKSSPPASQPA